jgi:hypothetical protein
MVECSKKTSVKAELKKKVSDDTLDTFENVANQEKE